MRQTRFAKPNFLQLVVGFAACLVCLVCMNGLARGDDNGERQSKSISVESAIVKLIDSVRVPSELPGVLTDLKFREGQMVSKGEEVGRIKSDELAVRLKRAQIESQISRATAENDIDVRFAEKSLEVSSAQVLRSVSSNQRVSGVVPTARLEEQKLEVHRDTLRVEQAARDQKIASMQVELAGIDVELSQILKDKSSIRSPIDGMVVSVETKPGEWVEPGNTIVKVVRMDRLKIEGFVPASIASRIRVGDLATATVDQEWLRDSIFKGKVIFINPEANPINSLVLIWVEIENKELKLVPGLEAILTIEYSGI